MLRRLVARSAFFLLLAAIIPCGCSVLRPDTGPTAAFQATTKSGAAPLQVQFTDESSPGSAPITEWTWLFGDGTRSTERNPAHVYEAEGNYSVTLHVSTKVSSDTEIKTGFISVSPRPVGPDAQFSGTPTGGGKPLTVQFSDQSNPGDGTIASWSWSFGDGGASTERNPSHLYENVGSYDVSLTVQTSFGTDTEAKPSYISVTSGPTAAFTGTPLAGLKPLVVQFTDQSIPGTSAITGWSWSFGDGGTGNTRNPSHTYATAGTYTVSLTVTTPDGTDGEEKAGYVVVSDPVLPTAAFSGSPRSGIRPLNVQFADLSTAGSYPITSWSWTFGDGGTSTAQNPSHSYTTAGSYTVALTVTTSAGNDSDTQSGYVVVSDPILPTAAFSGSPRSGSIPLSVTFTDQSSAGTYPITSWSWAFGDGGTSTAQNPSHTYAAAGSYTVTLTVATSAGSDGETKSAYIVATQPPTAAFSGTPRSGDKPLAVQFTDLSTAGSAPITSWSWSFGDGGTSTSQSPAHTYATAGTYTVALTVTTAAGSNTATKPAYITVSEPPVPPTANFSGAPTNGPVPLAVQFTDLSLPGTAAITSWAWSFGDGGTSTAQNPSHTYAAAGDYTITLTVTTSAGSDGETKSGYIVATQPPTAAFEGTPRTGDKPLTVQFTDLSSAGSAPITSWSWSFGDGGTSTSQSPARTYATAGTYTVALTVTTADGGNTATKPAYVIVTEPPLPPTADFSGSPTAGPAPLTVQFTDLSLPGTAAIASWLWSFGDATTSAAQNPSHTYLLPGTYAVSLTVTTADGADSATKDGYIVVCAPPTADFLASTTTGVAPLTVQFTDLSLPGEGPIGSWSWSFGDGGTSIEQSPAHAYTTPGVYDVSLIVSDGCGSDTETKSGYVTVQDSCNIVTYSIADAFVEVRADADNDGCAERARVHWDADVDAGCAKSVFARVQLRLKGTTDWALQFQSPCYTITGTGTADDNWVQVQNLPLGTYEIRIELLECGGTVPVAARDYLDDLDLDNKCFE